MWFCDFAPAVLSSVNVGAENLVGWTPSGLFQGAAVSVFVARRLASSFCVTVGTFPAVQSLAG